MISTFFFLSYIAFFRSSISTAKRFSSRPSLRSVDSCNFAKHYASCSALCRSMSMRYCSRSIRLVSMWRRLADCSIKEAAMSSSEVDISLSCFFLRSWLYCPPRLPHQLHLQPDSQATSSFRISAIFRILFPAATNCAFFIVCSSFFALTDSYFLSISRIKLSQSCSCSPCFSMISDSELVRLTFSLLFLMNRLNLWDSVLPFGRWLC